MVVTVEKRRLHDEICALLHWGDASVLDEPARCPGLHQEAHSPRVSDLVVALALDQQLVRNSLRMQ